MITGTGKKHRGLRVFAFCICLLLAAGLYVPGAASAVSPPEDGSGTAAAAEEEFTPGEEDSGGPGYSEPGYSEPGTAAGAQEGAAAEGQGTDDPGDVSDAEGQGTDDPGDVSDGGNAGAVSEEAGGDEMTAPVQIAAFGEFDDPQTDREATTLEELLGALADEETQIIEIPAEALITFEASTSYTVPAGKTVILTGDGKLVIPATATLTVSGSLDIETTGDDTTGSKGFCAVEVKNGGTLIVASGGSVHTHNSNNKSLTNNGVYTAGTTKFLGGSSLLIDCPSRLSRGVTVSDGGVLELAGDVDIQIPWTGDIVNYGIFLNGTYGSFPTLRITGGEINIENTGGAGIHTTPYSNPLEISGGTINVKNSSADNSHLTKGIELNVNTLFTGGEINIKNQGSNSPTNPPLSYSTLGVWNRGEQFIMAGGKVNIENSDPEMLSFFNDGQKAEIFYIVDKIGGVPVIDEGLVFHRGGGHIVYGTFIKVYNKLTNVPALDYSILVTPPGGGALDPVGYEDDLYYPLNTGMALMVIAPGYLWYEERPVEDVFTGPGETKEVYLDPGENAKAKITVTQIGLSGLKVGQPVSDDASIVYTLTNDVYAETINPQDFIITGLPAGLEQTEAARESDGIVVVKITGAPTKATGKPAAISFPGSLPAINFSESNASIKPFGYPAAGAVSRGSGAAVSGAPAVSGAAGINYIAVIPVTNTGSGGQCVEYAISTDGTALPADWQAYPLFCGLEPDTEYYVFARTAEDQNYEAGPELRSPGIFTGDNAVLLLTISSASVELTRDNDSVELTLEAGAAVLIPGKIEWSLGMNSSTVTGYVDFNSDGETADVSLREGARPAELLVTAVYDEKYAASVVLQILPGADKPTVTSLADLKAALADEVVTTIEIPVGSGIVLTGAEPFVIPAGKTVVLAGSGSYISAQTNALVISAEATLIIEGSLVFKENSVSASGSYLKYLINEGTLIVASGGLLNANNSSNSHGVNTSGVMRIDEGGTLLIDGDNTNTRGVVVSGGVFESAGNIDILGQVYFGVLVENSSNSLQSFRISGGTVNIENTWGTGVQTSGYSNPTLNHANPVVISGGTINILNNSSIKNVTTYGFNNYTDVLLTGGTINIANKGDNGSNNKTYGFFNHGYQFVIAGGEVNIENDDPGSYGFYNQGRDAVIILLENIDAIDNSRVYYTKTTTPDGGYLAHGTILKAVNAITKEPIEDFTAVLAYKGGSLDYVDSARTKVEFGGKTYYPFNAFKDNPDLDLKVTAPGYSPAGYTETPMTEFFPVTKMTKTVELEPILPSVSVTQSGLSSLKVGEAVSSSARFIFSVSNAAFAPESEISADAFEVSGLPPGLTIASVTRPNNTQVRVNITGAPTTAAAANTIIGLPSSIPAANFSATANTGYMPSAIPVVSGQLSLGPIAPGSGPPVTLSSISVSSGPTKSVYTAGEELDLTGLVVTAAYSDGTSKPVTGYTTDPAAGSVLSTASPLVPVTISYTEGGITKTTVFNVTVNPVAINSIYISSNPAKTEYTAGETLDLDGMIVTAAYSDGTEKPVTGYTTTPANGAVLNTAGTQTVTVRYSEDGKTSSAVFEIVVKAALAKPIGLKIVNTPDRLEYFVGDELDLTGLEVKVRYNDGSENAPVNPIVADPADGAVLGSIGIRPIELSCTEGGFDLNARFYVKVTAKPVFTIKQKNITGAEGAETISYDPVDVRTPMNTDKINLAAFAEVITGEGAEAVTNDVGVAAEWTSSDKKVATVVKGTGVVTKVGSGVVTITAKAGDSKTPGVVKGKTSSVTFTVEDTKPRLPVGAVTVFSRSSAGTVFDVLPTDTLSFDGIDIIKIVNNKGSETISAANPAKWIDCFELESVNPASTKWRLRLNESVNKNPSVVVPDGVYTLTMIAKDGASPSNGAGVFTLKATVKNAVPKPTVKMPVLNTFWENAEGQITVSAQGLVIDHVVLADSNTAKDGKVTDNFKVSPGGTITAKMDRVTPFTSLNSSKKPAVKGFLEVYYEGFGENCYRLPVTVSIKAVAPKLQIKPASQTINKASGLSATFEVTGGVLETDGVEMKAKVSANNAIDAITNTGGAITVTLNNTAKASNKLQLNAFLVDAAGPVLLRPEVKTTAAPSFKLSSSTVTLNSSLSGQNRTVRVVPNVTNFTAAAGDFDVSVSPAVAAGDAKVRASVAGVNKDILVEVGKDAAANSKGHKFTVTITPKTGAVKNLTLTVKVDAKNSNVTATVKAQKNKIDYVDRQNTMFVYAPTIKGTTSAILDVIDVESVDKNKKPVAGAGLFDVSWNETTNRVDVRTKPGGVYQKGKTYKLKFMFELEGGNYVTTKDVSIKPTQSAVKLSVPKNTTLYQSREEAANGAAIDLSPVKPVGAKIVSIEFKEEKTNKLANNPNNAFWYNFDYNKQELRIWVKEGTFAKAGKANLLFSVVYEGQGIEAYKTVNGKAISIADARPKPIDVKIPITVVK